MTGATDLADIARAHGHPARLNPDGRTLFVAYVKGRRWRIACIPAIETLLRAYLPYWASLRDE